MLAAIHNWNWNCFAFDFYPCSYSCCCLVLLLGEDEVLLLGPMRHKLCKMFGLLGSHA